METAFRKEYNFRQERIRKARRDWEKAKSKGDQVGMKREENRIAELQEWFAGGQR